MRTGNLLDILWRLKKAKNLDARQVTLVENAYYQCRPPERAAAKRKRRSPQQVRRPSPRAAPVRPVFVSLPSAGSTPHPCHPERNDAAVYGERAHNAPNPAAVTKRRARSA